MWARAALARVFTANDLPERFTRRAATSENVGMNVWPCAPTRRVSYCRGENRIRLINPKITARPPLHVVLYEHLHCGAADRTRPLNRHAQAAANGHVRA